MEPPTTKYRLDAYLTNMAARLIAMRRVISPAGSIYLHCDPTASHYLKIIMDAIYGKANFRNEIVWGYTGPGSPGMRQFNRKHDVILWYSAGDSWTFNADAVRIAHDAKTSENFKDGLTGSGFVADTYDLSPDGKVPETWWVQKKGNGLAIAARQKKQYLGYPTQKPLALLHRIIRASSNPGDLVLDPFCGCGTAVHAAESLGRRWIGIDVSAFSVGLIRKRVTGLGVEPDDIRLLGVPVTPRMARDLAAQDKFEFEKWACGHIGAKGLFHDPGTKGPDGGADGVLEFFPMHWNEKPKARYAVVQVKGGKVTPDSVGRLYNTVTKLGADAGVFVCFADQMRTVENERIRTEFKDVAGSYPVIQGLSVEDMLGGKQPRLPNLLQRAA